MKGRRDRSKLVVRLDFGCACIGAARKRDVNGQEANI